MKYHIASDDPSIWIRAQGRSTYFEGITRVLKVGGRWKDGSKEYGPLKTGLQTLFLGGVNAASAKIFEGLACPCDIQTLWQAQEATILMRSGLFSSNFQATSHPCGHSGSFQAQNENPLQKADLQKRQHCGWFEKLTIMGGFCHTRPSDERQRNYDKRTKTPFRSIVLSLS